MGEQLFGWRFVALSSWNVLILKLICLSDLVWSLLERKRSMTRFEYFDCAVAENKPWRIEKMTKIGGCSRQNVLCVVARAKSRCYSGVKNLNIIKTRNFEVQS